MPCRRLLAQLPTPTMPIAIFPIRLTRVRGRHQPVHGRASYTQRGESCKSPDGERALFLAEAGRELGGEVVLGVDRARLGEELLLRLGIVGVRHAAVDRAHRRALLLIEKPDALRALLGDDVIDVLLEGGMALPVVLPGNPAFVDGRVRALGLTGPAVDALGSDHRRHGVTRVSVGRDYNGLPGGETTGADPARPGPATASATRAARAANSRLTGCSGWAATSGRPASPPSRRAGTSGMRASTGTPKRAASASAPPRPRIGSSVPQPGQR